MGEKAVREEKPRKRQLKALCFILSVNLLAHHIII